MLDSRFILSERFKFECFYQRIKSVSIFFSKEGSGRESGKRENKFSLWRCNPPPKHTPTPTTLIDDDYRFYFQVDG